MTTRHSGANRRVVGPTATTAAIPASTVMLFMQAATPTGWTRLNTVDNRALRIIGTSGTGGATGGATAFDSVFGSGKTTGSDTPSITKTAAHTHQMYPASSGTNGIGGGQQGTFAGTPKNTASTGSGTSHSHTVSLDLHFVNILHCSKD